MQFDLAAPRTDWTASASRLVGDYFDLARPYIAEDCESLDPIVRFVSSQLFIDCHLSSESVLLLVRAGKEWDAEMVARSVVEGTLKYCYMLTGTENEARERSTEYWETLPGYSRARRSERAKQILERVPNPQDGCWRPFHDIVLADEEVAVLRGGTNRKARNELEERWSFAGIVKYFALSDMHEWRDAALLAHGYGISSHLIHKDGDGVGMVWDRFQRSPDRQAAVTLAHAARLVSDICAYAEFRIRTLLIACRIPVAEILEIRERYSPLYDKLRAASELFNSVEYGASPL